MSRRVKLSTKEKGEVLLLVIREKNGRWEEEWDSVRGTLYGDLFSRVSHEDFSHALHGWSYPLAKSLGLSPEGALIKIPKLSRECHRRRECPLYLQEDCHLKSKRMPWCFEPAQIEEELIRKTVAKAIEEWRNGVYLVVVPEGDLA